MRHGPMFSRPALRGYVVNQGELAMVSRDYVLESVSKTWESQVGASFLGLKVWHK